MAVYTHVDEAALTAFLALYGLPPASRTDGIVEGVENTNYRVETDGRVFILTLYEKRVSEADLPYFLGLMDHAVTHGVPTAAPIRDQRGELLNSLCGRLAALIEFVSGTSSTTPTKKMAHAAGAALGRLHAATMDYPHHRPNSLGPSGWQEMIVALGPRLNEITADLFDEVSQGIEALVQNWPTDLPTGTIHADLFPDNVLFEGDIVSAIIDFYFSCTDFYAYDLAITMNAWTIEGTTDPANARAIYAGYGTHRPLSTAEIAALPTLLMGAALRFLLTRAHDFLHQVPGSLVRVKDPLPYLTLFRHHRDHPHDFLEQLD
ncbi:MAG: homoserine kinase [Parvularcula sp.]